MSVRASIYLHDIMSHVVAWISLYSAGTAWLIFRMPRTECRKGRQYLAIIMIILPIHFKVSKPVKSLLSLPLKGKVPVISFLQVIGRVHTTWLTSKDWNLCFVLFLRNSHDALCLYSGLFALIILNYEGWTKFVKCLRRHYFMSSYFVCELLVISVTYNFFLHITCMSGCLNLGKGSWK